MSKYRKEKPCVYCEKNEAEMCDTDDSPCAYYEAYQEGRIYAENLMNHIISEQLKEQENADHKE